MKKIRGVKSVDGLVLNLGFSSRLKVYAGRKMERREGWMGEEVSFI